MLFPESKTAYVFDYILETHQPVICSYSIDEAYKVFEKKFPHKLESLKNFFDKKKYPEMREPNDVPILVSAVLSDSDILLTGDKDFDNLDLKRPLILSPSKYYDLIE
jgi:predicted nucleic acid-binding protein